MARPSNAQIEAEIEKAVEEVTHQIWLEMSDRWREAHSVVKSKSTDREVRTAFAVRKAVYGRLVDELNDRTSDLIPTHDDVKDLLK